MAVKWTKKQQQVIDSRDCNLLVSAAAGSGKTAVLVERIIQMISSKDKPIDIDKLLIMTFTNAAAAEMRERIGAAVDRKLQENPQDEHLWLQAALIPQAQITTIDSFCLNIIRNHYNTLDIDPGFRIGDEGELSLLQADVMENMLEECYQEGGEEFARFVEQFGRGRSDKGIEAVILQAWQFSQSHPWPKEWLSECRRELEEGDISQIEKQPWLEFLLQDVKRQMEELSVQLGQAIRVCGEENGPSAYEPMLLNDRRQVDALALAAGEGSFVRLYEELQNISFDRLASIRSKEIDQEKKAYVSACRDRVKKAVAKCRDTYGAQSPREVAESLYATRQPVGMLLTLADRFDTAYSAAKRERNVLDFNDLEHLALQVLLEEPAGEEASGTDGQPEKGEASGAKDQPAKEANSGAEGQLAKEADSRAKNRSSREAAPAMPVRRPSAVADELSRRYEEILVDEYQDSNYVQEALITSISRERFGRPNVFMVGDVKQSIYRFRLARPELFMEKYETYSEEAGPYRKIELQQNFRSRASVLDSVNDLFYQIMTKNLGGIRYTPDTALYPGAQFAPVEGNLEPGMAEAAAAGPQLEQVAGFQLKQAAGPRPGQAVHTRLAQPAASGISLQAGPPTRLLLADTGKESLRALDEEALDYTSRELEARMIAGEIHRMVSEGEGILVWDKELGENHQGAYRRARYSDMVILLRSMSGWSEPFVNVLMNEGIPALAQTRTGYFNTVEVETILSLLSVIDNPMQDIPLAAVVRSPIIGMDDEEMAWLMAAYKKNAAKSQDRGIYGAWKLWEEERERYLGQSSAPQAAPEPLQKEGWSAEASEVLAAVLSFAQENGYLQVGLAQVPAASAASIWAKLETLRLLLESLRREARYLPIHELLYRVYRRSGYYDYVSAMPAGETRRANLDMLVEKAAAYEATSYKGLFHFVRYIEKLKKFDTDFGEAVPPGENGNAVRIMSIHKSKGLEFPIVFLAGLGKRFNKQDAYGQLLLDADFGVAADYMDLELRVKAPTLKKLALKRRMELESMGEELRVLYVAMTRAKEMLVMTATDRSLESKLEKWGNVPLAEGQIPYTVLSGAGSMLDWLLMANPAIPAAHLEVRQIAVSELAGEEVLRQIDRQAAKEELLGLDLSRTYDEAMKEQMERALNSVYPFQDDIGLYAMVSVSELKKQSQPGISEETIGTWKMEPEGAYLLEPLLPPPAAQAQPAVSVVQPPPAAPAAQPQPTVPTAQAQPAVPAAQFQPAAPTASIRGTAYHRALECLSFWDIHSLAQTEQALLALYEQGFLTRDAYEFISPEIIWKFLESPLGHRMAKAQEEDRIHKEQQFMMGVPAREMGKGASDELVLIQGIIDAYLEEPDGLVLIDYKTDQVPKEKPGLAKNILKERYKVQLDYYARALSQLTGKKVKERIIYSLTLQESIPM